MTFWDFCSPLYDFAQNINGNAYANALKTARKHVPQNATVLDAAAGTGAFSLAVAAKAKSVLCTDISEKMLRIARKKAKKRKVTNIHFGKLNIFDIQKPDNAFDVVIAGQVLHLLDEPQKAAAELRRVAKNKVILPMCLTKNLRGSAKTKFSFYRLLGFAPKVEFDLDSYAEFLPQIGFENCEIISVSGKLPLAVAIWTKASKHGET